MRCEIIAKRVEVCEKMFIFMCINVDWAKGRFCPDNQFIYTERRMDDK